MATELECARRPPTGDERERQRHAVHRAGRGTADGPVRERGQHRPGREHLWKRRDGGELYGARGSESTSLLTSTASGGLG